MLSQLAPTLPYLRTPVNQADAQLNNTNIQILTGDKFDPSLHGYFSLRYMVLCEELRDLPAEDYPFHLESDQYDERAKHFLAKKNNLLQAGVRLVLHRHAEPFPLQEEFTLFDHIDLPAPQLVAEVSRLVIDRSLRRRTSDSIEGIPTINSFGGLSHNQILLLCLYRSMYRFSKHNGIRYWYSAMHQSRFVALSQLGIVFTPIGEEVTHHGYEAPYMIDLNMVEKQFSTMHSHLAHWFFRELVNPSQSHFSPS